MVIPEGYKKTEVGIIPEDWDVIDFGQVGLYYKGKGISMRDVRLYGNPCIMYGDIYVKFDTYFYDCDYYVDDITASKSSRALPQDLFFTASGETAEDIGRCVSYQGKDAIYIGGDIIALRPYNQYDGLFLSYVQNSHSLKRQKATFAQGNSVVHISTFNIQKTIFACPRKKKEQINISRALFDIDKIIDNLEKLIEKKKNIKQGAMQELLTGKRRLPGFDGKWTKVQLSQVLSYEQPTNYIVSSTDYSKTGTPVITAGKSFILGYTTEDTGICSSVPIILFDDFLTLSRYIDFPFKVKSSAVKLLSLKSPNYDLHFIFEIMQRISFPVLEHQRHWISQYSKIEITIPKTKEEQTAIATVLSDMDKEIEELEKKLEKYRYLKQGMMSELLSGHIRLTEKEGA